MTKPISNGVVTLVNIGSALAVFAAMLTFWTSADAQSSRLADSIAEVRGTVDDVRTTAASTRDAVMVLSGKVEAMSSTLNSSTTRTTSYLETLDQRVRALEIRDR